MAYKDLAIVEDEAEERGAGGGVPKQEALERAPDNGLRIGAADGVVVVAQGSRRSGEKGHDYYCCYY